MKKSVFFFSLFVFLLTTFSCESSHAVGKKKGKTLVAATVLESARNRIIQGRAESEVQLEYAISLLWNSTQAPTAFWWRGEDGWQNCRVAPYAGKGNASTSVEGNLDPEGMKKGDKVTIIPMAGGKFPIPTSIPATAKNTLYYQLKDSKLHPIKISKFTIDKEVAMP